MLLLSSVVGTIGAIVGICTAKAESISKVSACFIGCIAAVFAIMAGLQGILGAGSLTSFATPFAFANFTILLNPLSGLMLVVINVLALLAWIYGFSYLDEYKGKGIGAIGFFMNLFVVSMNMVITVDNAFWFLVFFELMSLTSYFLVIVEQKPESIRGGFLYLIMAHIGFLMIMISYLVMAGITGSFEFSDFRAASFEPGIASLIFCLAFLGFGCKAGMFPFHSWLPQAHPQAPSNVSALMSGGMIKIGIFGIVKVGLDLLSGSECQLWWGIFILVIGAFSSVLGVAYALGEHDIKKLLAYHSVENIGIILLGVGTGFMGVAIDQPAIAALGLMAGLYHLINHAMFKALLFLGAGSVLFSTGTRNMEIMGGLQKVMPVTGVCFLLGALAISAIPPLNGFVSEWFTYQSLFTIAFDSGDVVVKSFAAFAAVALAITGALAVTCFVKCYGVTFLGKARSEKAEKAKEVPVPMLVSMIVLACVCICLGVGAPWIADYVMGISSSILQGAGTLVAYNGNLMNYEMATVVSTPLVAVLLIAFVLLPFAIKQLMQKGGEASDREAWACGYNPTPDMPLVANSFGSEVKMFLRPIYTARTAITSMSGKFVAMFDKTVHGAEVAEGVGDKYVVDAVGTFITWLGHQAQKIEGGNFRIYIIYIVVALVIFLGLAVGLR